MASHDEQLDDAANVVARVDIGADAEVADATHQCVDALQRIAFSMF